MFNKIAKTIDNLFFWHTKAIITFTFILAIALYAFFVLKTDVDNNNQRQYIGGNTFVFVDGETGVNYFISTWGKYESITVRYNADGTVYVSEPLSE